MKNLNNWVKTRIKKIIFFLILIMLAIYFLPLPIPINTTLQGGRKDNLTTYDTVSISIKGVQLNYLFHANKIKGKLTIRPYEFEKSNSAVYTFKGDVFGTSNDMDIQWSTMMRYSEVLNRYTNCTVFFDSKIQNILLKDEKDNNYSYIAYKNNYIEWNKAFDSFKDY